MTGFTDPQKDTGAKPGEFRTKNKHQVAAKHKREHMLKLVIIAEQLMVLPPVCL